MRKKAPPGPLYAVVLGALFAFLPAGLAAQEEEESAGSGDSAEAVALHEPSDSEGEQVPLFDPGADPGVMDTGGDAGIAQSGPGETEPVATGPPAMGADSVPTGTGQVEASEGGLVPLFDPGQGGSTPSEARRANTSPSVDDSGVGGVDAVDPADGLVPLFDPGGNGSDQGTGGQADPVQERRGDAARGYADGEIGGGRAPVQGQGGDADMVPLYAPADRGRGRDPYAAPTDSVREFDVRGGFDGDGGDSYEDLDGDADFEPYEDAASALDSFDFTAARKLLSSEMTSPGDIQSVESVLEVVTPTDLDGDVGRIRLRGSNELGLDLRSIERFRWECRNEVSRRDVTLFGNGTVRLRRGPHAKPEMQLDELRSEVLGQYLSRLARIQRSQALKHDVAGHESFGQVDGELGESCQIVLRLPDLPLIGLTMPRLEVPQLGIAQLVEIADELASFTRPLNKPSQVSADYSPQPDDHLKRRDGQIFRVVGVTSDGGGVELEALQEPIRIFYLLQDLPGLFEPVRGEFSTEPVEAKEPEIREIVDIGGGI